MPRIVDHDRRRRELAAAVWSLIRDGGLPAVTIRAVSERSGWSSGAVRHYLPDRDAILAFAAEQVNVMAEERLRAVPMSGPPLRNVENLMLATLPVDEESRAWLEVWLAFVGAAVADHALADSQGLLYTELHALFQAILKDLAGNGWQLADTPSRLAVELHALVDGLAVHMLLGQVSVSRARQTIRRSIGRLLQAPVTD